MLPWVLLGAGSAASLAANVAVAQLTLMGRVIAAWPSFALIGAYEMLMRQVRRSAAVKGKPQAGKPASLAPDRKNGGASAGRSPARRPVLGEREQGIGGGGRDLQRQAWHWALANRASDGSLPSGRQIARQYGRHERWGRLVKRSGSAGQLSLAPTASGLQLVEHH
jgi:hypothetical protein